MLGTWTFRYSVVPHRGSWEDAKLWQAGQSFTSPMLAQFCETGGGTLPPEFSFISIEPATVLISTIKRSESGEGVIVRFYHGEPLSFFYGQAHLAKYRVPVNRSVDIFEIQHRSAPLSAPSHQYTLNG